MDGYCHDEKVSEAGGARAPEQAGQWAARAELAGRAVQARHLRRLWGMPGTLLGVSGRPASPSQRVHGPWNYWWQAHVLDCLVDAYIRSPDPSRQARVAKFVNGVRRRNGRDWLNDYYDDMAWLALALQRAQLYVDVRKAEAVSSLAEALRSGWSPDAGGGIWWRKKDKYDEDFKNVPTNGPAAILFARLRDQRGYEIAQWIEKHLVDPGTGVVWDGLHVGPSGANRGIREIETTRYTYCQGVYLGACLELACWGDDGGAAAWAERAARTVETVATHLTVPRGEKPVDDGGPQLILKGQGGGDGGLFAGILARYLAQAALILPDFGPGFARTAYLATDLVFDSAHAAWANRAPAPAGPIFGPEWSRPAESPRRGVPERDLSVQTGAWMLLEAAALLARTAP